MVDRTDNDLPPDPPLFDEPFEGDFRPEDWRSPEQGGPEISAFFVDDTLARIVADRAAIDLDAARVEDIVLPAELLAEYRAPEPSPDFVADCLGKIRQASEDDEHRLREILTHLDAPLAEPDFVERTLDALRVERSGLRLVDSPRDGLAADPPGNRDRRRASSWLIAAVVIAATVIIGAALQFWPNQAPAETETLLTTQSAQTYTEVAWGTTLSRMTERGIRFESVDALQLLANEAAFGSR